MRMKRMIWSLGVLVATRAISGQTVQPQAIPNEPTCPRCAIATRRLATLGSDDGLGSLNGKPMSINVDARGRYWVFQELEPPTVFSSSGSPDRMVGRKGRGPGEFESANNGVVIGDSMLVFDWMERRATMIGPDLKATQTIRTRYGVGNDVLVMQWPSQLITSGYMEDSDPPNSTVHRLSMESSEPRLVGSFGPRGTGGPMGNVQVQQHLGWARDGVWSAYWNKPQFTLWTAAGILQTSLVRRFDWYSGETPASLGWGRTAPTPVTGPIREDADGLLWIFIHKPAAEWQKAWEAKPMRIGGGTEYRAIDVGYDKLYRTYVEVIDTRTARVITSHIIDGYVMHALPDRRVALYRIDDNGIPRVDIVALTLTGR